MTSDSTNQPPFSRPGLRLAVPQSAMAACYPPRAAYKMHLDSYFLQGARGGREEEGKLIGQVVVFQSWRDVDESSKSER